eukprot:991652-Prorocentrum_minimum.AAC.1
MFLIISPHLVLGAHAEDGHRRVRGVGRPLVQYSVVSVPQEALPEGIEGSVRVGSMELEAVVLLPPAEVRVAQEAKVLPAGAARHRIAVVARLLTRDPHTHKTRHLL